MSSELVNFRVEYFDKHGERQILQASTFAGTGHDKRPITAGIYVKEDVPAGRGGMTLDHTASNEEKRLTLDLLTRFLFSE